MADLNMKILIVDDSDYVRMVIKNFLIQIGFKNFHEADDGTTALAKLKYEKFDFIMADWDMPKMDGLELLKSIKEDKELKNIPFMMVTAKGMKEDILAAFHAGAAAYVVKPFNANDIEEKIKNIFG